MKKEMHDHASVFVGGRIYSCGGTEAFKRGQMRNEQGWMKWIEIIEPNAEQNEREFFSFLL